MNFFILTALTASFFLSTSVLAQQDSVSTENTTEQSKSSESTGLIIIALISALVIFLALVSIYFCIGVIIWRRKKKALKEIQCLQQNIGEEVNHPQSIASCFVSFVSDCNSYAPMLESVVIEDWGDSMDPVLDDVAAANRREPFKKAKSITLDEW
jgi:hypothetical protein